MSAEIVHTERLVGGVRLHCAEAGPEGGPLVLLLHGFPDFWHAWDRQIGPLARAGFRVVAPDLRGYNLSEKPPGLEAYHIRKLVGDVVGLMRELGYARMYLVGHDWGGVIAWATAHACPQFIEKLVILNAPHPNAFQRELKRPEQQRKSWYIKFFQLPWLPEKFIVPFGRWALGGARAGSYSAEDLNLYEQAWRQPGAATAMLNYYRALVRLGGSGGECTIPMPTLLLWGERDAALVPEMAQGLEEWVPDLHVVKFPRGTHWVMRDEALRVNQELLNFLE